MEFDVFGHLVPYELIQSDLVTFEAVFVTDFPASQTRHRIYEAFTVYLQRLREVIGNGFFIWVDDSFVTRKLNPRDIDFVTFLDFDRYAKHEADMEILRQMRFERDGLTDGFFVKVYPESHPNRKFYELDRAEWLFDFGRSRTRHNTPTRNKGLVELIF
jgi:hypothetical protein